jgi:hypothetical protein
MTKIQTEQELDERLSRPSDADVSGLAAVDGDLIILGASGKMGPSLARLARRAANRAKVEKKIIAVARFTNEIVRSQLASEGIEIVTCDLLEPGAPSGLPDAADVVYMAARKFGTTGSKYLSWAINTYLPGLVAERYRNSRIVTFSVHSITKLNRIIQTQNRDQCAPSVRSVFKHPFPAERRIARIRLADRPTLIRPRHPVAPVAADKRSRCPAISPAEMIHWISGWSSAPLICGWGWWCVQALSAFAG